MAILEINLDQLNSVDPRRSDFAKPENDFKQYKKAADKWYWNQAQIHLRLIQMHRIIELRKGETNE